MAKILTMDKEAKAEKGIEWIKKLCRIFDVPTLGYYGLGEKDMPSLIANSLRASSMQGNPIKLKEKEIEQILMKAL